MYLLPKYSSQQTRNKRTTFPYQKPPIKTQQKCEKYLKVLSRLVASQTKPDKQFAEGNGKKYGGKMTEKENNTKYSIFQPHSDDDNKRTGRMGSANNN